ncbi:MAG: VanZ family protein [Deltaproteobacteria bacterium]|nr:VanZ family protein [Deltaproteobacteria bacterium]
MKKWIPLLLYASFLFYLSHQPSIEPPEFFGWLFLSDKLLHVGAYTPFGLLLARAVKRHKLLIAFLGATLYGLSDEFHQSFIPGRMVEIGDLVADAVGGFVGGLLYLRLQKWPKLSRIME